MTKYDMGKQIDAAWAVYQQEIEHIADHMMTTRLNPYFKKHNIVFLSAMGSYYLSRDGICVNPESLPKWLQNILDREIPGMSGYSLGTMMDDRQKK